MGAVGSTLGRRTQNHRASRASRAGRAGREWRVKAGEKVKGFMGATRKVEGICLCSFPPFFVSSLILFPFVFFLFFGRRTQKGWRGNLLTGQDQSRGAQGLRHSVWLRSGGLRWGG